MFGELSMRGMGERFRFRKVFDRLCTLRDMGVIGVGRSGGVEGE